ncbi:MAG TPA: VOC family protein [Phototrophicaceae bacterium]|nr:VOC family protein [Phototrophicaceae bacterium]
MTEPGFGSQIVTQVGVIVHDIERSIDRYCAILGVTERPDVIITDTQDKARTEYKGQPTPARAKLAFFHVGQVDIELIEPIDGPSTWRAFLEEKGEGVHHIAFFVKDTDGAVRFLGQQNVPVEQVGYYTGGMYTYLDSSAALGVRLELLQNLPE